MASVMLTLVGFPLPLFFFGWFGWGRGNGGPFFNLMPMWS